MLPGPVFTNELRVASRRLRLYILRCLVGVGLLWPILAYTEMRSGQTELSISEVASIGTRLFTLVVWVQALTILLLTPAMVAGSIAEDRQRKILSYLLASPLTGPEIVLGKLAARLLNLVMLVSVGLPVLSIALLFGGIAPEMLWSSFAAALASIYFLSGLSMAVSTFSSRPRDAIFATFLLEIAWLFSPMARDVSQLLVGRYAELIRPAMPYLEWVTCTSPIWLLMEFERGASHSLDAVVAWSIGLQLCYGTILLAWSTWSLRPIERGWLSIASGRRPTARRLSRRRSFGDDPMMWKECSGAITIRGKAHTAVVALELLGAILGLSIWMVQMAMPAFISVHWAVPGSYSVEAMQLNVSIRIITAILYLLGSLLLASVASTGITSESEKDTWVSLVSSTLEGEEILRAKLLGSLWRVRYVYGVLAIVWLVGVICGGMHPLALLLCILTTAVYSGFIAALGTYVSLQSKSSARAITLTLGILIFLNGGYLFCCIPMRGGPNSPVFAAGITPFLVTAAAFTSSELDWTFRASSASHSGGEMPGTYLVSLFCYGIATAVLISMSYKVFDIVLDRPRRTSPGSNRLDAASDATPVLDDQEP